jgi:hypothetical protein
VSRNKVTNLGVLLGRYLGCLCSLLGGLLVDLEKEQRDVNNGVYRTQMDRTWSPYLVIVGLGLLFDLHVRVGLLLLHVAIVHGRFRSRRAVGRRRAARTRTRVRRRGSCQPFTTMVLVLVLLVPAGARLATRTRLVPMVVGLVVRGAGPLARPGRGAGSVEKFGLNIAVLRLVVGRGVDPVPLRIRRKPLVEQPDSLVVAEQIAK